MATAANTTTGIIYLLSISGTIPVSGPITGADGSASAPSYSFTNNSNRGIYNDTSNTGIGFAVGGAQVATLNANGFYFNGSIQVSQGGAVQWSGGASFLNSSDLIFLREGAGYGIIRNSTNAQRFGVANTYTSSSNNETFAIDWQTQANNVLIGSRTAATGTGRTALFVAQGSSATTAYAGFAANRVGGITVGSLTSFTVAGNLGADATFGTTSGNSGLFAASGTNTSTSGTNFGVLIAPIYNQSSGNAANTDLLIARTETAVGSGTQRLISAQVSGSEKFGVDNGGSASFSNSLTTLKFLTNSTGDGQTVGAGNANSSAVYTTGISSIGNASAKDVLTVNVPNGAHSAMLKVTLLGALGAGGAVGAHEATGTISYDFSITRTAGVNAVVTASTAYGSATSSVSGGATITITAAASAVSGSSSATQTFTVQTTISRGSGSSTNHTCTVYARVVNQVGSGVTISAINN